MRERERENFVSYNDKIIKMFKVKQIKQPLYSLTQWFLTVELRKTMTMLVYLVYLV